MRREEAKKRLLLRRAIDAGMPHPDMAEDEAVALAGRDPELGKWWEDQQRFHAHMAEAVRATPVPADLAARILTARKTERPWFLPSPAAWAAAAAVLLLGLSAIFFRPQPRGDGGAAFDVFRSRMVRTVLREYRMDVVTNDIAAIRTFLASHQAPADFPLPPQLAALPPIGGGLLHWQGRGVSMVCLDGGRLGTLFLFVAPADSLQADRPQAPVPAEIGRLGTVAWSDSGRTFVLAAHASVEEIRGLL